MSASPSSVSTEGQALTKASVAGKDDTEGDDSLQATEKPIETAYQVRRRRTFGTAPAKKKDLPSTQSSIMEVDMDLQVGSEDRREAECIRPWGMDDKEDEVYLSESLNENEGTPSSETQDVRISVNENSRANDGILDKKDQDDPSDEEEKESISQTPLDNQPNDGVVADLEASKDVQQDAERVAAKNNKKGQPRWEEIQMSVDNIFCEAKAKGELENVTVKDVAKALEIEYEFTLSKPTRTKIRQRLVDLVSGNAKPRIEKEVSSDEERGSELEISGDESSEDEQEEPTSDYEDEEAPTKPKTSRRPAEKGAKVKKSPSGTKGRRKSTRKNPSKKKKSSIHEHAEKLRQKRMQELRVRNEELQLEQSKEDRKRAELIAAKFETDTDEMRLQRLEDRLDLLEKLDQKRQQVMEAGGIERHEKLIKQEADDISLEDDASDSDDEMELEIVGAVDADKPLFPSMAAVAKAEKDKKSTALSVLDMADLASPLAKKNPTEKKNFLANLRKNQPQISPTRNVNTRARLRSNLLKKQRQVGNMWLARELGYKNEQEHLQDCIEVEKKKRNIVLQREAERLATNQRNKLRERFLEPEIEGDPDLDDGDADESDGDDAEEDEEMALAKQVETEQEMAADAVAANQDLTDSGPKDLNVEGKGPENVSPLERGTEPSSPVHGAVDSQDDYYPDAQPFDLPNKNDQGMEDSQTSRSTAADLTTELEVETQEFDTQAPPPNLIAKMNEAKHQENGDPSTDSPALMAKDQPVTPESEQLDSADKDEDIADTDDEKEDVSPQESIANKQPKDRNAAWKAMLESEAKKLKMLKKRKGGSEFLETEADEEEEEEVAGLEDFGFSLRKNKENEDDDDDVDDKLTEDDLKHVVDDISDDEGDEEVGEKMRRAMAEKEEKERHKEMMRRMREGYDGRRGGIAGGGSGARGIHRFDQLVAADNREGAKQLGLLNDDELDSDDEAKGEKKDHDDEEDEAVLLDQMLKDRFLHRSNVELEETFSDDEEEDENKEPGTDEANDEDEQEQEKLAKRFAKRARMQRLMDEYGNDEEFTNSRLIEEDSNMKGELSQMKNGLARKRSISSASRVSSVSTVSSNSQQHDSKRQKTSSIFGGTFLSSKGSLSLALKSSRQQKSKRTSFLGNSQSSSRSHSQDLGVTSQRSVSFGDTQISSADEDAHFSLLGTKTSRGNLVGRGPSSTSSLWSKVMSTRN